MLPSPKHSQKVDYNLKVLFVPLTDAQIIAIRGLYQDSLPIRMTVPADSENPVETLHATSLQYGI